MGLMVIWLVWLFRILNSRLFLIFLRGAACLDSGRTPDACAKKWIWVQIDHEL
jgi:hypothetical protein